MARDKAAPKSAVPSPARNAAQTRASTHDAGHKAAPAERRRPRPAFRRARIRGALGTIGADSAPPRSFGGRLIALAAILGPGVIVMVGDNDAGGVAIYTQAGQNYGTGLLWPWVWSAGAAELDLPTGAGSGRPNARGGRCLDCNSSQDRRGRRCARSGSWPYVGTWSWRSCS